RLISSGWAIVTRSPSLTSVAIGIGAALPLSCRGPYAPYPFEPRRRIGYTLVPPAGNAVEQRKQCALVAHVAAAVEGAYRGCERPLPRRRRPHSIEDDHGSVRLHHPHHFADRAPRGGVGQMMQKADTDRRRECAIGKGQRDGVGHHNAAAPIGGFDPREIDVNAD